MPFRPSGDQLVLKLWCVVGSFPPLFKKGVYLLDLTALEHRCDGFKYCRTGQLGTSFQSRRASPCMVRRAQEVFGDGQGKVLEGGRC